MRSDFETCGYPLCYLGTQIVVKHIMRDQSTSVVQAMIIFLEYYHKDY